MKTRLKYLILGLVVSASAMLGVTAGLKLSTRTSLPITAAKAAVGDDNSALASAEAVQEAFRRVSAQVLPTVVEITVKNQNPVTGESSEELPWNDFFADPNEQQPEGPQFYRSNGLGSGVIVEIEGDVHYVLTNAHVIGEGDEIQVELQDGSMQEAFLVGTDPRKDLAILRFEESEAELSAINIGDSNKLYIGDWVLAFGSPYGYEHSVSSGIVSALGRRDGPGENINDFIQTDAAINQGNSGGPLVNIRGELVGVNTFITTPNSGSIGLGFAIPVNNVKSTIRQLIDTGEVRYGWLGASLGAYGTETAESMGFGDSSGTMVYQIFTDSPGDKGDMRPGDLILAVDGVEYGDTENLIYAIGDKAPGDSVEFTVLRAGKQTSLSIRMGTRGGEDAVRSIHGSAWPGFVAAPLTEDVSEAMGLPEATVGTPVAEVYPRTVAHSADLRAGDIIIGIAGITVESLSDLYAALAQTDRSTFTFTVMRAGEELVLQTGTIDGEEENFESIEGGDDE